MVHTRKPTVNSITNGSRDLVGRCAVFDTADQNQIVGFASYLIRVRVDPSKVLPRYLAYFLNSTKGRAEKLAGELGHSLEHSYCGGANCSARRQATLPRVLVNVGRGAGAVRSYNLDL
jgi:hypothetical protein